MPTIVAADFLRNLMLSAINAGASAKITDDVMEHPRLAALSPQMRRYVSLALASAIASAFFVLYCWLVSAWPETPQHWANDLVGVAFLAIMASQTIHGATKLSPKPKPKPAAAAPGATHTQS
jgi:hypothetical protein